MTGAAPIWKNQGVRDASLIAGLALIFFLGFYRAYHSFISSFEFGHYADIGRFFLREGAYMTKLTIPANLAQWDSVGKSYNGPWPVYDRFPFPAFVVVFLMKLMGVRDISVAFSTGIFYILSAVLLY